MAVDKRIFILAGLVTLLIFISIIFSNILLSKERERVILEKMIDVIEEYEEMETISAMSNLFGEEITCITLENQLSYMDKSLWDLGIKMDKYKQVTEEFLEDPFYIKQKRKFNRNEVMYLTLFKKMKKECEVNQTIILYFYKKAEECKKCDDQSFVLTDLNEDIDPEISIFSFDANLELPSVNILTEFYNVTSYPCIVIEDDIYCGLYDKNSLIKLLCEYQELSIC